MSGMSLPPRGRVRTSSTGEANGVVEKYKLLQDFTSHQKIGSGGFGLVLQVKKAGETAVTAVKMIPFENRIPAKKTIEEAEKLSSISPHPSVVRCIDFWIDSFTPAEHQKFLALVKPNRNEKFNSFPINSNKLEFLCIQMQLCGNGNLRNWLKRRVEARVNFLESIEIFLQIEAGISHIHGHGIIHRDLKPANILFEGACAKISDLGWSVTHNSGDYTHTTNAGANLYQAPEQSYGQYGRPVDYYALGLILFELFYPASQVNVGQSITNIKFERSSPIELQRAYPEVAELIKKLISVEASHRPNSSQILEEMNQWKSIPAERKSSLFSSLGKVFLECKSCFKALLGTRFKCTVCTSYFLCEECEKNNTHPISHDLVKIRTPPEPVVNNNGRGTSGDGPENNRMRGACTHYRRNCQIQCPVKDCARFFPCRVCHDETIKGHKLNRKQVNQIQCNGCFEKQIPGKACVNCGIKFARYVCLECKLFDDSVDADNLIFHCNDCGFCRRKENKLTRYAHCENCSMCYPKYLIRDDGAMRFPEHLCKTNAGKENCQVCGKEMHESRESATLVDCHHYVHTSCKQEFPEGQTKCPVCGFW